MAYEAINYEPEALRPEGKIQDLVDSAEARFEAFYAQKMNRRYPRYIASEPAQVYAALKWVTDRGLAPGGTFIEWGSGFGVATGMAALLGYEATGIELRQGLVDIARELLDRLAIKADFLCTSYIPEGYIEYETAGGSDLVPDDSFGHQLESGPVYQDEDREIEIDEVDLFYVYPWPGEQEMMLKLFDAVAGVDAILIAYYGDLETCIYRKL
jgi:SAM-dependent methyltransferase